MGLDNSLSKSSGLVLTGGGARGAYQVGVLHALTEIAKPHLHFDVLTGISVGAINASFLAAHAEDMRVATEKMIMHWRKIHPSDVFETNLWSYAKNALRWIWDIGFGGIHRHTHARALLNTAPLAAYLQSLIPYENIRRNLSQGHFQALAVSAINYGNSKTATFVETNKEFSPWEFRRRYSQMTMITPHHILASCAIPFLFPPVQVKNEYYGDGSLRNLAPLSPAVHLGADKLLIIGVRRQNYMEIMARERVFSPSVGHVLNVILNGIILDSIDVDIERLDRMNQFLKRISESERAKQPAKVLDYLWLNPIQDIGKIAEGYHNRLPRILRYFLRGLGSSKEVSDIMSYLLFDHHFCSTLIELGYEDTMQRKEEVLNFLSS